MRQDHSEDKLSKIPLGYPRASNSVGMGVEAQDFAFVTGSQGSDATGLWTVLY